MRKLLLVLVLLGFFGGLINAALLGHAEGIPSDSISIDFKDIDLNDLLDILSAKTGLNIIASPEVEGKVPVARFENVPVLKVLEIILESFDYQYEIGDNIIRVSSIPLLSQNFTLKSALVGEVVSSLKPLLSEVGKMELNKETNSLLTTDKPKRMEEIAKTILKLDDPARQLFTHSFSLQFVQAEAISSLIQPHLSRLGKLETDSSTNSLLITDTRYSLSKIEKVILSLDHFRAQEKLFSLKFALAPEVAKLIQGYLTPEGDFKVREDKNEILVRASSYSLEKIEHLIAKLDTPSKQMKEEKFLIRYINLKDLAEVVKENLSSQGKLKIDPSSSTLTVEDTSYHLLQIERMVTKLDTFQPRKRIYKISFAPLSLVATRVEDLLSDKGTVEIQEETSSLVVVDVKKNLKILDKLIPQLDTIENQLIPPFNFKGLDLKEVLALLSTKTGLTIIAPPEVKGKVSASFERSIPVLKALKIILEPHDYEYQVMDNIIRVSSIPLLSQNFTLKSALVGEVVSSLKPLLSEVGKMELNKETNSLLTTDKPKRMEEIAKTILKLDDPARQLFTHSFSLQFVQAEAISSLIQPHLSRLGKLETDSSTNSLLITDTRYSLSKIEKVIASVDVYMPLKEIFTVKYALAEELLDRVRGLLSDFGKAEVDEITNTIILIDGKARLEKIKLMLISEDTIEKQTTTQSFYLKYAQANSIVSSVENLLTLSGKLELHPSTNSLLITDTRYTLVRIGQLISKFDYFRPSQKLFVLKFALAPQAAKIARPHLSDKGKIEVNEEENQVMVTATSYNLKKMEDLLAKLDTPSKQMKEEKFLIRYINLKDLAEVVKENLSSQGKLKIDPSSSTLTVEDTSYHLLQIERMVTKLDTFQPRKRIYKISFAPLSLVATRVEDLLSDKGTVEIQEETSSLVVVDVKKNLDHIDNLVRQIDTLEGQLETERFFLKYLTPQEAEFLLQGAISEYGKIHLPQAENIESRSSTSDYIVIPQEKMDSPEETNPSDKKIGRENNIIYVTDLKRQMPQIDEVVREINGRAEEVAVRTFHIKVGSLEPIAIAIANMLGIKPEEIEGIELRKEEGKWMEMEVPSPSVNLGTIGPAE